MHVDDVLQELDPHEMDERLAAEWLDGEWRQTLLGTLRLGFTAVCRAWGMKMEPKDFDPKYMRGPEDGATPESDTEPVASPNAAAALAMTMLGKPHRRE